ncbi:hypothetical protein ACFXJ8_38130 [Nonomuraea sp. NPDC059194]|uniref:hypothetical protein n=1 Tax=Nonomuraea sp. NPDC059194 TaxID=3346764 RepID=UPI0036BC6241
MKRFAIMTAGVALALGVAAAPAVAAITPGPAPARANTDEIGDLLGSLLGGADLLEGLGLGG